MAHEIDMTTGQAAVFTVRKPAWHRLGKVIDSAPTSEEAIKLACMDWRVEKCLLYARVPSGGDASVPDQFGLVRTDTNAVLGTCSAQYRVFQNSEAFEFMDSLVGEKLAMYETAGSLFGGRKVWMLARIPKEYKVGGQDVVNPYTLLTTTHDGTGSLRMIPTGVRVVCANTLSLALRGQDAVGVRIVHRPKLKQRVEEARASLGIVCKRFDEFGEEMQTLARRQLSVRESYDYFEELFPTRVESKANFMPLFGAGGDGASLLDSILDQQGQGEEVVARLLEGHYAASKAAADRNREILDLVLHNYESERNHLPGIEHTAWAAYNSVSEWADHQAKVRGKSDAARLENRVNSIWFGAANQVKQRAYTAAMALAK